MVIKFWGTRGSVPVPGKNTIRYGGNTPCLQIISAKGETLIIDAGTGIRELGNYLLKSSGSNQLKLFISHTHWDHIQGLPFFGPFYFPDYLINIYSSIENGVSSDHIFDAQMNPFFFPVNKDVFKAKVKYHKISPGHQYHFNDLKVQTCKVHHSKGTLAFKFIENGKSAVYMTDNEIFYDTENNKPNFDSISDQNEDLINFCRNADYLIHDSMYSLKDYNSKIGWGHSNNISLAHFSMYAGIKNLVLFHYDPDYTDQVVDSLLENTKKFLTKNSSPIKCLASSENMKIKV